MCPHHLCVTVWLRAVKSVTHQCARCGTGYPLPPGATSWRCKQCNAMNGGGGMGSHNTTHAAHMQHCRAYRQYHNSPPPASCCLMLVPPYRVIPSQSTCRCCTTQRASSRPTARGVLCVQLHYTVRVGDSERSLLKPQCLVLYFPHDEEWDNVLIACNCMTHAVGFDTVSGRCVMQLWYVRMSNATDTLLFALPRIDENCPVSVFAASAPQLQFSIFSLTG